ncbi:hypothetical protein YenMTG1_113 [Yersinia phage vB_YenM_TG1]|uniref:Uncharacterized protein n=1 Tax=Yersinia phage vB_YenM_TG1 TaxID=1589265 RepID=A0A0B4ZZG9_9CAUD|nr:hypothetical protein AVV33_gp113 [Yersinia phage vB_YenM_TG1]AJD81923.1 hypothetical protein YenMTG1_113 [Yersinia phage vB_YenM_TG1]
MNKQEKDLLLETINELVSANREQVWEESRWDSSKSGLMHSARNVEEAETNLISLISRLK